MSDDDFLYSSDDEDAVMEESVTGGDEVEDDYEELEDDEDRNFLPVVPERDIKRPYEVDFVVHSPQDILQFQQKEMVHVAGILGCSTSTAATLLRHFRWNKEKLIESYMDSPDTVTQQAGVIMEAAPCLAVLPAFECDICCNDEPHLESLCLSCNHRFCRDCYQQYLTMKITQEGESRLISCPASGCPIIVDEKTVEKLVDQQTYRKYCDLLMRTYVDDSSQLKWCPAPNCEYAIECKVRQSQLDEIVPTVTCKCQHSFCFGCGIPNHQPSVCRITRLWLKKCADDSETANWINANTKECAKCSSSIEKNGGCNHMSCRKCKYEFCWVCLGPWSEHGTTWYSCNRFEEKSGADARDQQAKSRQALARYLHYYNRYANHEQSAKLDKELYEKTEKKMEEMQKTSELSWIEVQFFQKAADVLLASRMTLKWTYCFAYYLARDNATQLFEDNQSDLEMAVEALSELLERPIDPSKAVEVRQQVLDKTAYVASRREIVLQDTCKGLAEGRWKYVLPEAN